MDVRPTLSIKDRTSGEKQTYQMDQESIVIGRDRSNYIILDSKRISRRHAEIRFEDGAFFVIDLESGNGTSLNNQKLNPHEKNLLRPNDNIQIESYEIAFHTDGGLHRDFGDVTDPNILEVKMIKKLLKAVDKENAPILEVAGGKEVGKRFVLEGKTQEIVIGRDPACEFQIDADVISRKHVRVVKKWDTVTLIDLASKNGVYINDARVSEAVLSDGDRILLGTLPLLYRNPAEQEFDFLASQPPPETELPPAPQTVEAESSLLESEAESGARISRRDEEPRAEAAPSVEAGASQPPPVQSPSEGAADEPQVPFWHRISVVELIAGGIGITILIGSIWFLMKLL